MKPQQAVEMQPGCPGSAFKWGRGVGYGIAIGTVLGTVVGIVTKHALFVYAGMLLGAAIGTVLKSRQTRNGDGPQ